MEIVHSSVHFYHHYSANLVIILYHLNGHKRADHIRFQEIGEIERKVINAWHTE